MPVDNSAAADAAQRAGFVKHANLGFAPGQVDRRQGERFRVCLVRFRKFPHGLWQLVETFPEALEVHGEADAFFGRLKDDESRRLPRT
jgi:hypothetical protein